MTRRQFAAPIYVCVVLTYGAGFAFYPSFSTPGSLQLALTVIFGMLGLAALTFPFGLIVFLLSKMAPGLDFGWLDGWFLLVAPLASLIGYWQWFHFFPYLFSSLERQRQKLKTSEFRLEQPNFVTWVVGMRRSRAIALYVFAVCIIGFGFSVLILLSSHWIDFRDWLREHGYFIEMQALIGLSNAAVCFLTFPFGSVAILLVNLPLLFFGIATSPEALFLTTPVAAFLGALQWFWVFPNLYKKKSNIAEIF